MNCSFEAALNARLLWIDVIWLQDIAGAATATQKAIQAALDAVDRLVALEVHVRCQYGSHPPLLLQDVPVLAEHYCREYAELLSDALGSEPALEELVYRYEEDQYLQDLADTYAETERELVAGWKADCLDNDHF